MDQDTELLEWVGPVGHVSPTYGELRPGERYPVPAEQVDAFLATPDCWARPAAKRPAARVKETE